MHSLKFNFSCHDSFTEVLNLLGVRKTLCIDQVFQTEEWTVTSDNELIPGTYLFRD